MADEQSIPGLPSTEEMKEIFQSRNDKLREDWIKVYEARLVRQELKKCYLGEGVNHHQECKHLVDMYSELLKDARVKGFRKIDT